jgi:AhpD family alkylhydroperoxidase
MAGATPAVGSAAKRLVTPDAGIHADKGKRSTNMASEISAFFEGWQGDRQKMKAQVPALAGAFGTLHQTVMKEGALSVREKELIALAIGLADRCTPCINLHVQGCLKAGATREQVLEAAGVAVLMQGGPAFTHLPEVLAALDHLEGAAGG